MNSSRTTKQILFRIAVIIILVELLLMGLAGLFPFHQHPSLAGVFDVSFMVLLTTPLVYLWVIKPFILAHNEAVHQAKHDPLTLVSNRRYLFDYLKESMAICAKNKNFAALLFIDLDDFKSINDKYGHDSGDALLVEVANRMKSVTRQTDMVFRVGGDEFVVLIHLLHESLDEVNKESIEIAKRYQQAISKPFMFHDKTLTVGSSIGIRVIDDMHTNQKVLIKQADSAMYQAKQKSKDYIALYDKNMMGQEKVPTVTH